MNAQASIDETELHRIAVFGAGSSGRAAARLCLETGLECQVYDEAGMGDHTEFSEADAVRYDGFVFSPGFTSDHPWRILAERSRRHCFGELGFAMRLWCGKVVGVTGTNGKTTVTALIQRALEASGRKAVTAGNIGRPLSDLCSQHGGDADVWAVCEISSFQAELPAGIKLEALVWTNFAEDHLDRYSDMREYFKAKANLLHCLKPHGFLVLGESVKAWDPDLRRSDTAPSETDDFEVGSESPFALYPQADNFKLAARLWNRLGLPYEALNAAAADFVLAPHRLAIIAEWGGVRFWNDSKATNFSAVLAALNVVEKPIFWISGGRSKGGGVATFAKSAAIRCEGVYLYGETAQEMASALEDIEPPVKSYQFFTDAVTNAVKDAVKFGSGSVLLSPGFAAFGEFESYAKRGESFTLTVLSLKNRMLAN